MYFVTVAVADQNDGGAAAADVDIVADDGMLVCLLSGGI